MTWLTTPETGIEVNDVEQCDVSENIQLSFDSPNASKSNDKVKPEIIILSSWCSGILRAVVCMRFMFCLMCANMMF